MFAITPATVKWIKGSKAEIDNNVFKLHYRLTAMLIIVFFAVIGARKYFGDPIDCTTEKDKERLIDNFCWFRIYLIVPRESTRKYIGLGESHIHRTYINNDIKSLEDLKNHDLYEARFLYFYQWVEFILFLQAGLFFLPRYLWRYCWEQGRVRTLTENLKRITLNPDEDKETLTKIVQFFNRNNNGNTEYTLKFIACEILNFINVLTQFLVIQKTFNLDHDTLFEDFFYSESNFNPEHPINLIFPKVARCEVPNSRGGGLVPNQEYCVLPVNVFTTKIYIFLWFHFFMLCIVSGLFLVYRVLTFAIPDFRRFLLMRVGGLSRREYNDALSYLTYGDWFLVMFLGDNMDPTSFENFILEYNRQMKSTTTSKTSKLSLASINGSEPETLYDSDYYAAAAKKMKEMEMEQ